MCMPVFFALYMCQIKDRNMGKEFGMGKLSQTRAPIYEALERFRRDRVVPFDVPGHKHGRGNPELVQLLGERCVSIDVNSMKPLDNLCHPISVIREAEELAADAFGADRSFFLVNGTTCGNEAMIISSVKEGEKILVAENCHKSALMGLIISGAKPVFIRPSVSSSFRAFSSVTPESVAAGVFL